LLCVLQVFLSFSSIYFHQQEKSMQQGVLFDLEAGIIKL